MDLIPLATKGKTFYKWTTWNGEGPYSHSSRFGKAFQFDLPVKGPGKWHTVKGALRMCSNGFHFVSADSVRYWKPMMGSPSCDRLFVVEVKSPYKDRNKHAVKKAFKGVCRSIRLAREIKKGSREWAKLMKDSRL